MNSKTIVDEHIKEIKDNSPNLKETIVALNKYGMTKEDIAKTVNVSESYVAQILHND